MRTITSLIVAAAVCLLAEGTGTRLVADPDVPDVYSVGILYEDASCPTATHSMRTCPNYPTGVYVAFDKQKGKQHSMENSYVIALGMLDLESCAPKPLIRVIRMERAEVIPFCWDELP